MRIRDRFLQRLKEGLGQAAVDAKRPLVVAVSGGPDSMALLQGLLELRPESGPPLIAAHFNHRLRGLESEGDARFVADACRERGIECVSGTGDVHQFQRASGLSPEAAARRLRYDFLGHVVADHGAQAVATGHTMHDQAETVLLNATRGSGLRGIRAMQPRFEQMLLSRGTPSLTVVRPMLQIRRTETTEFCRACGIKPRRDRSNEDDAIPRNRIRRHVLPQLEEINPEAVAALARLAATTALDVDLIDREVARVWADLSEDGDPGGISLDRSSLGDVHPALRRHLLIEAYRRAAGTAEGLGLVHVEQMADLVSGRTGARLDLPGGVCMRVDYQRVLFDSPGENAAQDACPFPPSIAPTALKAPGITLIAEGCFISITEVDAPRDPARGAPWVAHLDAQAVKGKLIARSRRGGDRFQPLGLPYQRKLQDFLVDERAPREWRDRIPLVEARRGIAWVVGYRPAEWAKVTPLSKETLRLEYTRDR